MYKILKKEHLAAANYLMEIDAPMIAKSGKAGQFVIVIDNEKGERIPLTIADLDPEKGILTIVFQAIGASTMRLAKMEAGEELYCCVGPLGRASDLVELSDEELKAKKKEELIANKTGMNLEKVQKVNLNIFYLIKYFGKIFRKRTFKFKIFFVNIKNDINSIITA